MLVLVNLDNPHETEPIESRAKAQDKAAELGWSQFAAVELTDLFTAEKINELRDAQMRTAVTEARLISEDGYVYEFTFSEDGREIRVAGRESSIACPRDALDGE